MERTLARAREVLRARDLRFLLGARLASQFGDGLFQAVLVASVVFTPEKQSTTVGFAKAVAILAVGFRAVVGITVAIWFIAPLFVARIHSDLRPIRERQPGTLREDLSRVASELRDGARRLLRTPRALAPITSVALGQFVQGLVLV